MKLNKEGMNNTQLTSSNDTHNKLLVNVFGSLVNRMVGNHLVNSSTSYVFI